MFIVLRGTTYTCTSYGEFGYSKMTEKRSGPAPGVRLTEVICASAVKIFNTPIPEKTGSCMQARLNSPPATKMADGISEELGNSWNVCMFRATCPEQMMRKGKKNWTRVLCS